MASRKRKIDASWAVFVKKGHDHVKSLLDGMEPDLWVKSVTNKKVALEALQDVLFRDGGKATMEVLERARRGAELLDAKTFLKKKSCRLTPPSLCCSAWTRVLQVYVQATALQAFCLEAKVQRLCFTGVTIWLPDVNASKLCANTRLSGKSFS